MVELGERVWSCAHLRDGRVEEQLHTKENSPAFYWGLCWSFLLITFPLKFSCKLSRA